MQDDRRDAAHHGQQHVGPEGLGDAQAREPDVEAHVAPDPRELVISQEQLDYRVGGLHLGFGQVAHRHRGVETAQKRVG
eukprot:scaffold3577_cov63-Phaeocystis_antarctica.AAC.7